MEIQGEKTINVNGKEYWTVEQFSKFTQREKPTIRNYCSKGNRLRKLESITLSKNVLLIECNELFNFPFVITGRPGEEGDYVEMFYMENGEVLREEKFLKRDGGQEVEE